MTDAWRGVLIACLLLGLSGCGGLRYLEASPEAKDFHPRTVIALPADVKTFPEAKGVIDQLVAEVLKETGWFTEVAGGEALQRRLKTDEPLGRAIESYLEKLDKVSFSDLALSSQIGEWTKTEALLLVRVDYWNHQEEIDKKLGKVSLSLSLVEAKTGKILWRASHQKVSEYLIIKPELPNVAKSLLREMVGQMPH